MDIFKNNVVQNELKRLESLIGTDGGRDVELDIDILTQALSTINHYLLNSNEEYVIVEMDMWDECWKSLEVIFEELNLEFDESKSNYDFHKYAIVKSN